MSFGANKVYWYWNRERTKQYRFFFSHDAKSVDVKTYTRFSKLYPKYILIWKKLRYRRWWGSSGREESWCGVHFWGTYIPRTLSCIRRSRGTILIFKLELWYINTAYVNFENVSLWKCMEYCHHFDCRYMQPVSHMCRATVLTKRKVFLWFAMFGWKSIWCFTWCNCKHLFPPPSLHDVLTKINTKIKNPVLKIAKIDLFLTYNVYYLKVSRQSHGFKVFWQVSNPSVE